MDGVRSQGATVMALQAACDAAIEMAVVGINDTFAIATLIGGDLESPLLTNSACKRGFALVIWLEARGHSI